MSYQLQTSIVFLIYRRPEITRRAFEAIRNVRPANLFVIADGPRTPEETSLVAETRSIIDGVDWPCEVHKNYVDENLGLKQRVVSGLDWVFEQVEEAIILEDDCVAAPSFFRFCEELLEYYRNEPRVMHISGHNHQPPAHRDNLTSYSFTRYPHVWGWATWRRSWRLFDAKLEQWADTATKSRVLAQLNTTRERDFWDTILERVYIGEIDSWAYGWSFSCFVQEALSIIPKENLVENIGFGDAATHTQSKRDIRADLRAHSIPFPLIHPTTLEADQTADDYTARKFYRFPSRFKVLGARLKHYLRGILSHT